MYKVSIAFTDKGFALSIYQQRYPEGRWYIAKKISLEFEEIKDGEPHEPTLAINHIQGEFLLEALREALEPMPVKKEKEIRMKERIKALEEHLNDLRQILKITSDPKRLVRV